MSVSNHQEALMQFQSLMENLDEQQNNTFQGQPVFAVGVWLSTLDKVPEIYYIQSHIQMNEYRDRVILPMATKNHGRFIGNCVKVLDMTGLKLSALDQLKLTLYVGPYLLQLLTAIATIDDLNYPEKADTYYVVNATYVFSACWKIVKPLLHEITKKKVLVLQSCRQGGIAEGNGLCIPPAFVQQ